MSSAPAPLPFELRIGVTGHRQIADAGQAAAAVDALLDHIERTFETAAESPRGPAGLRRSLVRRLDTALAHAVSLAWRSLPLGQKHVPPERRTPLEWIVVSPLARGADQIVARAVLRRRPARGRPQVRVVTPLPLDEYRRDFEDPQDRREFEELLALDPAPVQLNPEYSRRLSGLTPDEARSLRNEAYLEGGRQVVDACEVLIALWDGAPAAGRGGTGDVVRYAVEQRRTVLWIDASDLSRPARLVVNQESAGRHHQGQPLAEGMVHLPLPVRAAELSANFHNLAAYNRDPAFAAAEYESIVDRESQRLRRIAAKAGLSEELLAPVLTNLLPNQARADQLALRYQQLHLFAATWLHYLAAIAVSVVVLQYLFFRETVSLVLLEILAMVAVVVLLRISRNETWHEKWLRDRHLAEQIRSIAFTTLVGPVAAGPDSPSAALPFYRGLESWVRRILDRLRADAQPGVISPTEFDAVKRFVIDGWIVGQAEYHSGNSAREHAALHRSHRLGLALFVLTLCMATLHFLGVGHGAHGEHAGSETWVSRTITALAILLPAWGAAIHSINTLRERERIVERSRQMAALLYGIASRAEQATTLDDLRVEVRSAAAIMAAENHEWWVTLSFRGPVLPA